MKKRLSKIWTGKAKAVRVTAFEKVIILFFFVALTFSLVATNVDNANLIANPYGWHIDREGQFIVSDSNYEHTAGNPSILLTATDPKGNNPNRECNSAVIPVDVGQHVVYSCWIKITESGLGDTDPYSGARIGIDFYDSHLITGVAATTYPNTDSEVLTNYVQWGTSGWTQKTIEFTMPSSVASDGTYYPVGEQHTATGLILWLQVWSSTYGSNDPGQAWFADTELYIDSVAHPLTTS